MGTIDHHVQAVRHSTQAYRKNGFTLIELLVTIAIIGVLAALALPSFQRLIASTNVTSTVNSFVSDTRYARGEAMRRGKNITICRSNAPAAAAPTCSLGDGLAVGGWKEGWVVFEDLNDNGAFNNGETVLKVQEAFSSIGDIYAVGKHPLVSAIAMNSITYDANGRAVGQEARWLVHAPGSLALDTGITRTLCMNSVGRVRILQGEVAC